MKIFIFAALLVLSQQGITQETITVRKYDKVYTFVEVMPQFPNVDSLLYNYLARRIVYPDSAKQNQIQGKVFTSFIVEIDGSISNLKTERSPHPLLSAEAIRVIMLMPNWIPGEQNGKAVRVRYVLPIYFKLS